MHKIKDVQVFDNGTYWYVWKKPPRKNVPKTFDEKVVGLQTLFPLYSVL